MRGIRAVLAFLAGVAGGLIDFLATVLGGFLGHWTPPAWLQPLLDHLRELSVATRAWSQRHPRGVVAWVVVASLLVVAVAGGLRYRTVLALRQAATATVPQGVTVEVSAPQASCYDCPTAEGRTPFDLTLRFQASVAPLALAGQDLPTERPGVTLTPALPGRWHWDDDHTLVFHPARDWPVGQHFTVRFADAGFTQDGVTLAQNELAFDTEPFKVWVQESQFVQDPVNPALRTAQILLRSAYPIDEQSLRAHLSLRYVDFAPGAGPEGVAGEAPAWTLSFDSAHLLATLRTASLALPAQAARLELTVQPGVVSTLGGNALREAQLARVEIPGRDGLKVNEMTAGIARDADDTPVQALTVQLSLSATEAEVRGKVKAWVLPLRHPDAKVQQAYEQQAEGNDQKPYPWTAATAAPLLARSEPLALSYDTLEADHSDFHSFRHKGEPGRYVLVRVPRGLQAFGGYQLGADVDGVLQIPAFPVELRLTDQGALLALSGAKKLTVFSRDLPGIRVRIGRLLPQQLQHVVSQTSGRFDRFDWYNRWTFDESNLTETFTRDIALPALDHGVAHYESLDLAPYLAQGEATRRGIFFLRLEGYDPANGQAVAANQLAEDDYGPRTHDTRLVVVTDLGLVTKRNADRTQDVFVQSIASGEPVAGVTLEVIGKNGQPVLSRSTDGDGHAKLPELSGFQREKEPILLLARKAGDESFLPLNDHDTGLNLSRFDIGGVSQPVEAGTLSAYLFTDRGLYRPGESAHIGVIVRASEFAHALPQTPVIYEVTDPRGTVVLKTTRTLPASGLDELEFTSAASAPSGGYTVTAWLPGATVKERRRIGSLDFKVREFEPDRLKIHLALDATRAQGWLKPEAIHNAQIDLQNLFGTPAQQRRVTGELKLTPWLPRFESYPGWQFTDPQAATEGVTVNLNDVQTDDDGQAKLDIDLKPYAASTYFLHLTAQGFEPGGGRGVTAEAGQVISTLPYLVGWKAEGALSWIAKDSKPSVSLMAIDPEAKRTAADGLKLRRYERKWVSVLVRSGSGYYHYESRQKDNLLSEGKLAVPAGGKALALDTTQPGSYQYVISDAQEHVFARIPYEVSGYGNVTRNLDRNAELKLALSKKDYAPGEEVELNLVAPYAGAGLITIEREKVLAWKWFKASTSASVQKIKLPEGLEGSAYVHVLFTRDPSSREVFASPLSYGVAPFSVAIDARRAPLTLDAPGKIKPGDTLRLRLTAGKPGRAVVYAVDEGIHQVARYKAPNPLAFYFQKRSLDVETLQILDLILPEFRGLPATAAPGGDADAALGAHLNPFKRKTDAPIAWWSGIVDVGPEARTLEWTVPDRFNGALKLVAVSVAPDAIGVAEGKTLVRGDFTLLPNAPLAVTPGDEFEVSTGVANNLESAPKNAPIVVTLAPTPNLEVLDAATQTIPVSALHEGIARWRVRAKDGLGNAELVFTASYGGKSARIRSTLSVRPPMPYSPNLAMVQVAPGKSIDLPVTHSQEFYPQFRKLEASVSGLPLVMAHGLTAYLGNYRNYCTEQLTSMAMPALVLSARPEFGEVKQADRDGVRGGSITALINELALRQRPEGDFAYWDRGSAGNEPVSIYALHFLLEASEHGISVPPGLIEAGNRFLTAVARQEPRRDRETDAGDRNSRRLYGYSDRDVAYAIYLLTRQGQLMAAEADAVVKRLDASDRHWRQDTTALWLAAAYARMQQKPLADALVNGVITRSGAGSASRRWAWEQGGWGFANDMSVDAEILYILAKHFPAQLAQYGPVLAQGLVAALNQGRYQTYASGTTLLALDAYATLAAQQQGKAAVAEVAANGTVTPLAVPAGAMPKITVSPAATKLRVSNSGTLPVYALLAEMGFPKRLPAATEAHGIEILRTFQDASGSSVSKATLGQELTVEIKLRALDRDAVTGVALVDLLPGGFEIVQTTPEAAAPPLQAAAPVDAPASPENEEGDGEGNGGEPAAVDPAGACNCDWVTVRNGSLTFAEPREDRAVLYATATREVQVLRYRIKAVTAGRFGVPPAYGEAMYDRSVFAWSTGGLLEVVKP